MANNLQLWVSGDTGRILSSPTTASPSNRLVFYAGDSLELEVHLVQGVGVARVPYEVPFPAGSSVKVSIGTVATSPTSGNWRLSVSSTETADLAYNATPAAVQSALNAIGAVAAAGGVTVSALGGGYSITWNTVGTKPTILAGSDTLVPSSYESIYTLQAGSASVQEIVFVELRQSPLALADSFTPIGAPVATSTIVSAWNGTNKIVRVSISPSPRSGTYTIDVDGDSSAIPVFANSSQVYSLLTTAGATAVGAVNQTDVLSFDIVLTQDVAVSVDGSGLIESYGIIGTLNLATSEVIAYLGSGASADAVIEVSVTAAGQTRTMAQVACTVANAVISPGAVTPVAAGVLLTESVANARFIRRDAAQSPSAADLDIIWPNLGVSVDGSDLAAALSAANAPASGNPIATMADVPTFDQLLNTTNDVSFTGVFVGGVLINPTDITFPDSTVQTTAFIPSNISSTYQTIAGMSSYQTVAGMSSYLTTASASSTYQTISGMSSYLTTATAASTYAQLASFDQGVTTSDSVSFTGLTLTAFGTITFPDSTVQYSAPVASPGTVIHSGGGGHIDALDYPDEVTININGTNYAMPARVI